jgi:hypothetical protein
MYRDSCLRLLGLQLQVELRDVGALVPVEKLLPGRRQVLVQR